MATFSSRLEEGLNTKMLNTALGDAELQSGADAEALIAALPRIPPRDDDFFSPVYVVAQLVRSTEDKAAVEVLRRSFDAVLAFYDRAFAFAFGRSAQDSPARFDDLVFFLAAIGLYPSTGRGGVERTIAAARDPSLADEYAWVHITEIYGHPTHPYREAFVDGLRSPLPVGVAAVTYLDMCNRLARERMLDHHPFAASKGVDRLHAWLTDRDPKHFSFAQSAAAALPFIDADARARLLALASAHPERSVQLEAAWADASVGGTRGLEVLTNACRDAHSAIAAMTYLQELGQGARIPAASKEPNFAAKADMSRWLQHPNELGRVPDVLELYDTRVLDWPPTNDRRRVWLFRYESGKRKGLGMVGSVTFALFGETTEGLSPEDAYALHCCWELEGNRDPRAPNKRSVAAGRELLGFSTSSRS